MMNCCPWRIRACFTLLGLVACSAVLKAVEEYTVFIEAKSNEFDRIRVTITLPSLAGESTVIFPVTVPGTYEEHLWWRMVREFKALNAEGAELAHRRTSDSQFVVPPNTAKVDYWLDDSFDEADERVSIFHPTGTSFQGDSVFVFNHGGMVCYVEGKQQLPYTVTVHHKPGITAVTALPIVRRTESAETYRARTYDELVDGPVMICRPDTTSFSVDGVQILVAVCGSKPNQPMAPAYSIPFRRATQAVGMFLPKMPVDRYAFLIYLWDGDTVNVRRARYAQGALEHNYSSLYFWRYNPTPVGLEEIAAHEFLHILVPLNLHSREIDAFDFRRPLMSEHLWLYEGVTEYFAHLSRLRAEHIEEEQFLNVMNDCAKSLRYLPDSFALTQFSRNVLKPENQRLFPVIYEVGPLNALVMDIIVRQETNGRLGVLEMIYELMNDYGPSKPFDDANLFEEIARVSSEKVRDYCMRHIASAKPVPLAEYLPLIGWEFHDSIQDTILTFDVRFMVEEQNDSLIRIQPGALNPLRVVTGDVLRKIDGSDVDPARQGMLKRLRHTESTDPISVTVERDGKLIELTAPPVRTTQILRGVIRARTDPTADQRAFRRLVLYGRSASGD